MSCEKPDYRSTKRADGSIKYADRSPERADRSTKDDRSFAKPETFKRPTSFRKPQRKPNYIPDHRKNPHKWTKYTLEDVSADQMSDRSNTKAALQFLTELKDQKRE